MREKRTLCSSSSEADSDTIDHETPCLFNIEAQTTDAQFVLSEELILAPRLNVEPWTMPESGNRYFRLLAPPAWRPGR